MLPAVALFAALFLPASSRAAVSPVGHWVGTATQGGDRWTLSMEIKKRGDALEATVDFIDLAAYGLPFAITSSAKGVHLERSQPAGGSITIDAEIRDDRMEGVFAGLGMNAEFRAARSAQAPEIREQEVVFHNGNTTIAGTLMLPNGNGPFPGMVCTHGSGNIVRTFAAYRSEGVFYARLGFATLIYDKRGSGNSSGDLASASLEDLADDALAGVRALKGRPDVIASQIGVSGISQGGWVAPLAATRSPDVAFVIVISPCSINPMEQSIFNVENVMRSAGYSEAAVARATDLRRRIYSAVRTGHPDPDVQSLIDAARNEAWFAASQLPASVPAEVSSGERAFLLFDPLPMWRRLSVPVLALWGGMDTQVPSRESQRAIEAALNPSNADHTLILYPLGNHNLLLPRAKGGFPHVAIASRRAMADWLRERFKIPATGWMP
jgi:pimeloyl-ACP methyl ester carboxylesterase